MKNWRVFAALAVLLTLASWAFWSYESGGILRVLLVAPTDGSTTLEALRAYVLGWGMWAPVVYIAAVTVEVLVAPIPGGEIPPPQPELTSPPEDAEAPPPVTAAPPPTNRPAAKDPAPASLPF